MAKSVTLLSPASLTLADDNMVEETDRSFNWYHKTHNKGARRSEVLAFDLAQLNPTLKIDMVETTKISGDAVSQYNLFILTDCYDMMAIEGWNSTCRDHNVGFILANCIGCFGSLFVDFGKHKVMDKYYLPTKTQYYVKNITNDKPGIAEIFKPTRPIFIEDGDYVVFNGVAGMVEVNGSDPRPVKMVDAESFAIESTIGYGKYSGGGTVSYEKVPSTIIFDSFKYNLLKPKIKSGNGVGQMEMHVCMLIYFELREELEVDVCHACDDFTEEDIEQHISDVMVARESVKGLIAVYKLDPNRLKKLVFQMVFVRKAQLLAMSNLIANLAAFQVVCLSGKLIPVNQWFYFDLTEQYPDSFVESLGSAPFDPLKQHYESFKMMRPNLLDHSCLK